MRYSLIRCPNKRPHSIYSVCGHCIGAVSIETATDYTVANYCSMCKKWWIIKVTSAGIEMSESKTDLSMINTQKVIE
jgi:hypothetical protein